MALCSKSPREKQDGGLCERGSSQMTDASKEARAAQDAEYREKKERVRRGELCYYCMKRPPTKTAIHAADGAHLPACDECFDNQVQIAGTRSRLSMGCLAIGVGLIGLLVFAVARCG